MSNTSIIGPAKKKKPVSFKKGGAKGTQSIRTGNETPENTLMHGKIKKGRRGTSDGFMNK